MNARSRRGPLAVVFFILCGTLAWASNVGAAEPRVRADFYGVNYQAIANQSLTMQRSQLASIDAAGIDQARLNFSWAAIEPLPPAGDVHDYRWDVMDQRVALMARSGIRAQGLITQTPSWAGPSGLWVDTACARAPSRKPLAISPYVDLTQAIAKRYGRGGSFWQQHPSLPSRPIIRYEIWNEPNLKGGWCPAPEPEVYSQMFVRSARAIRAVDPGAEVILGGLAPPARANNEYLNLDTFLSRAIVREPAIKQLATAAAVHIYPSTDPALGLKRIAWFRDQLRAGQVPDSMPMLINELGWSTYGGSAAVGEPERAEAYAAATVNIPRTNCNVLGILPHTWNTTEVGRSPEAYFGIADPRTAELYPSGQAYSRGVNLMRGKLAAEPPRTTLKVCPGMPLPDQDGDGTPDEKDTAPLNPSVPGTGSGPSPGPSPSPAPGPGPGPGLDPGPGESDRIGCTVRLVRLTQKMADSTGQKRTSLKRRYRRVERRCVPCKRKMARIKRKLERANGAQERRLERRQRRVKTRCGPCIRRLHRLQILTLNATELEKAEYLLRHERVRTRCNGRRRS